MANALRITTSLRIWLEASINRCFIENEVGPIVTLSVCRRLRTRIVLRIVGVTDMMVDRVRDTTHKRESRVV